MSLAFYQQKLASLKVDRSSGHPKPHKVCLLLALMDCMAADATHANRFTLEELEPGFTEHFARLRKGNDAENIQLPFFHLAGDGVWHLKIRTVREADFQALKSPSKKQLRELVEYAYLDAALFDYMRSQSCAPLIREALLENLEDFSDQFHRWLLGLGKSEKTASSYLGAIRGAISSWAYEAGITEQNLIGIPSYSKFVGVAEQVASYSGFIEQNTRGKQMYSAALNHYKAFLAEASQSEVTEDINAIIQDQTIDVTQKSVMVNARVGQGVFREKLVNYWKGCALTGYPSLPFLVASHIKPWRAANDTERLDRYNGILLLPNLDKAFDLGYITFESTGAIRISAQVEDRAMLGLRDDMKIALEQQHQDYLAYHRDVVFERRVRLG